MPTSLPERLLLDTVFIQALLNRRDQYHGIAREIFPHVRSASEIWISEAVLIEVGNALSALNRQGAVQFIRKCYQTSNIHISPIGPPHLRRALEIYSSHQDKHWGLTDCLSFALMEEQRLTHAVTADEHFVQAGYNAVMRSQ